MNYFEFKNEYINTLREFLAIDKAEDNYPKMIFGPSSNDLANKLADLEESICCKINLTTNLSTMARDAGFLGEN